MLVSVNALVTEIPHVIKVRFDPFKDVKPLADLSRSGAWCSSATRRCPRRPCRVVAYVKANPGKVSYASYSLGTISHTMGLELNKAAGIDMTRALQGLAAGICRT